VYAEDPARGFLPSIGTLEYLATPEDGARIDTGVREGDTITPFYDPMIAKLIVHGSTRREAIARLRAALAKFHVVGVRTNIEFLHRLTGAASFTEARLDTALIERESAWLFPPREVLPGPLWDLAALAFALVWRRSRGAGSPWDENDHWRNSGAGERHWRLRHEDDVQDLRLSLGPSTLRIHRDGVLHTMSGEIGSDGRLRADIDGVPFEANVFIRGGTIHLFREGHHHLLEWIDPYLPVSTALEHHGGLVAPMPGRVIAVLVENGARVAAGTALVVMEAMKMEHTVTAPSAGVITDIHCAAGEQVREGDELLKLSPAS
jgi:3-methylcrotonyl-CoA carboxylase alpha subunit